MEESGAGSRTVQIISDPYKIISDWDPGGPKTYGFGTLVTCMLWTQVLNILYCMVYGSESVDVGKGK